MWKRPTPYEGAQHCEFFWTLLRENNVSTKEKKLMTGGDDCRTSIMYFEQQYQTKKCLCQRIHFITATATAEKQGNKFFVFVFFFAANWEDV